MKQPSLGRLLSAVSLTFFISPLLHAESKTVGNVNFSISCEKKSQDLFNHALAQVHNMMYVQAEQEFNKIIRSDPKCAMGYWGIALTQVHPLWADQPSEEVLKKGSDALKKARTVGSLTDREKAYIDALQTFYTDWKTVPDKERIRRWEQAQLKLHQQFPEDPDATAFYALTHLATAPKGDKSFQHQKESGILLEELYIKHPMHPAAFHYTIHAYDNPALAEKAEGFARGYDKIAPDVPHALHMPSHIFVRIGQWPETIAWNIRSAAAAEALPLAGGVMSMHYAHALDYLMYAYLQQGDYENAKKVLEQLMAVKQFQKSFPAAYGIAATQARYYLEQDLWEDAAKLGTEHPTAYPWEKFPAAASITYFAKGLGNIQSGNLELAQSSVKKLNALYDKLRDQKENYWAVLVDSKRKTLQAWIALKKGDKEGALTMMKTAADLEDSVDKHPVTPGEVLPARELYADMLLKVNRPADALNEYEAVLKTSPNRLRSLTGISKAKKMVEDSSS